MSFLFDEVFLYDFDEENLSFKKRFQKPFCIQVIDESDKLLIRSRVNQNNVSDVENLTEANNLLNNSVTSDPNFSIEIYKDTPCSEFGNNGFVITDENARSIYLIFNKKFTYENEKANYSEIDLYRFTKLVNDFKLGRRESVFTLRTDEASASQYFQFYGYLSQQQNMMQDFVRTSTYQRAILSNGDDFKDKVILDVGAGSGILSFFAIQAGARKVFAVEASSMAKHAEQLVASNKLSDKILVIPGKIEEINLPEKVDIIISEPMGYMLFNERMLETYLHAKKWLKPSGKMFPTQADLHIAPFSDAQLYTEQLTKANFWFQQNFHGVDLTVLREAALKEYFYQPVVDTFDVRICIAKSNKHTIDFLKAHEKDLHVIDIPLKFHITQTDEIHGLAFWFDVGFFGSQQSVWLSTAPTQPLTHWYQVRCLLDKPLFVQRGHTVTGRVVLVSNRRQSYNVKLELSIDEIPGSHSSNSLDLKNPYFRYTGQPVQPPPGCNQTSPSEDYWQQVDAQNNIQMNGRNINILNGNGLSSTTNNYNVNQMGQVIQQQPQIIDQNQFISTGHILNTTPTNASINTNGSLRLFGSNTNHQQVVANNVPVALNNYSTMIVNSNDNSSVQSFPNSLQPSNNQQNHSVQQNGIVPMFDTGPLANNVSGINMNFPVNQSLMIGDYAAAVSGQTIPPYKPM
ncbi:Histone-arginine methyltransferase CARMER [Sarcoptes scabiei]|uniref:type I protein arginine methyltransferase n=1 Tax=Sarcoptes scabiei TaxID=52283 RepID=A0A834R057_SARSC|nr:Histone-arginine methyltransferase CARMER [Sarcoptes scabiei]